MSGCPVCHADKNTRCPQWCPTWRTIPRPGRERYEGAAFILAVIAWMLGVCASTVTGWVIAGIFFAGSVQCHQLATHDRSAPASRRAANRHGKRHHI